MTKNDKILVLTHKNPDTDSVCSALALAQLYGYTPVACGELNSQTEYVLKKQPSSNLRFLDSLQREAHEFMKPVITINENSFLKNAIEIMFKKRIRSLLVVDDSMHLKGMLTSRVLSDSSLKGVRLENIRKHIIFSDLAKVLNGTMILHPINDDIIGKFMIAAMEAVDFHGKVMKDDVIITGLREDIIDISLEMGITKFIITGRTTIPQEITTKFEKANAGVIIVTMDTFYTAHLIQFSLEIKEIMIKNVETLKLSSLEKEISQLLSKVPYALAVIDKQQKVAGIISRTDFISLPPRKVVLVDHNEFSQAIEGIENADILAIYDHHRLGDIQTTSPVFVRNEPIGSTSTVIYKMYNEQHRKITKKTAYWLICGILSDTLLLNSPTTTKTDEVAVRKLAEISGVDYVRLGKKLITVKFGSKMQNIFYVISEDYKEYSIKNKNIGIAQIELIKASNYQNILKKVISKLYDFRKSRGLDILMLMITDVAENGTYLYYDASDTITIENLFNQKLTQGMFVLSLFSRKKQLFPELVYSLSNQ